MKFDNCVFFLNLSRKFKFHYNLARFTGILHNYQYTFSTISRSVLLRMINVSDESCRESPNTHLGSFFFFRKLCFYEIMWKNIVQSGRLQMIIRHMRIAYWITKTTNTHSAYAIFIVFLHQQWIHGCASL